MGLTSPAAGREALGRLISVHRERHPLLCAKGGVSVLIGVVILVFMLPIALSLREWGFNPLSLQTATLLVGALVALWTGGRYIVPRLRAPRHCVHLFSEGLTLERGKGVETYRWEDLGEVETLAHRSRWATSYEHQLRFHDGSRFLIDSRFTQAEDLGTVVRSCFESGVVKQHLARLRAGEELTLGPVRLGREGLTLHEREFFPYRSLKPIDLTGESFYLHEEGKALAHTAINWGRLPSGPLLPRLVDHLIREGSA